MRFDVQCLSESALQSAMSLSATMSFNVAMSFSVQCSSESALQSAMSFGLGVAAMSFNVTMSFCVF